MLSSLASIATLMLSTLLMMAGFGLMGYMLPIRSLNEGWSTVIISVIATGYTFGFTVSCIVTPISCSAISMAILLWLMNRNCVPALISVTSLR